MKYYDYLTSRETYILELLSNGCENREIAGKLYVSPHTVKAHISVILKKMHAKNRTHAVYKAVKDGILD